MSTKCVIISVLKKYRFGVADALPRPTLHHHALMATTLARATRTKMGQTAGSWPIEKA